jgi:hypothetical protein
VICSTCPGVSTTLPDGLNPTPARSMTSPGARPLIVFVGIEALVAPSICSVLPKPARMIGTAPAVPELPISSVAPLMLIALPKVSAPFTTSAPPLMVTAPEMVSAPFKTSVPPLTVTAPAKFCGPFKAKIWNCGTIREPPPVRLPANTPPENVKVPLSTTAPARTPP